MRHQVTSYLLLALFALGTASIHNVSDQVIDQCRDATDTIFKAAKTPEQAEIIAMVVANEIKEGRTHITQIDTAVKLALVIAEKLAADMPKSSKRTK